MAYTDIEFLNKIKPYVIKDMKDNNILASLTAGQAFIESNKGNSGLTTKANNLFGIKGSYNGESVSMLTTEYYKNDKGVQVPTKVYADFRKYPSWQESINDHSAFLRKYKRYASIIGEKNYIIACDKMGKSGYATSPTYGATLLNIINKYQLYTWDNTIEQTKLLSNVYIEGQTYTLKSNMYVRALPGGTKLKFDALTVNAKKNAHFDNEGCAILNAGTRVTCKGIFPMGNQTWMKIPSGYVCAIGEKVYIE